MNLFIEERRVRSVDLDSITLGELREWHEKASKLKTIGEFKKLGLELKEKHGLTDREVIDILNGNLFQTKH
jgi:hypothetical protein